MKIHYKANKLPEIIILTVAILISVIVTVIFSKSLWLMFPYILLEGIILYFLLNNNYVFENQYIKIKYGFYTCRKISIRSISKIFIQDKEKGEPKNSPYRIEIHYKTNKKYIITPQNPESFVENIECLRPDIEII